MADLNVTVGADAAQYNRAMQGVAQTATTTANSVQASAARIDRSITTTGAAVARGSNQAGNALTNLGRVAQDAPFGFIGIQNNLNPLLESFQRLRQEAGSNVGALRALAGSLMGAGGLGLALSVVGGAILLYQKYMQGAAKAVKETQSAQEGYIKTVDDEVAKVITLYGATQNLALSHTERLAAVNELQKEYPAYFKNLSDEAILAGKAKSAYDSLTNSIINQAIVKAGQDKIKDTLKPLIESIVEQRKLQAEIDKSNAQGNQKNPFKQQSFDLTDQNGNKIPGMTEVASGGYKNRVIQSFIDDQTTEAIKAGRSGVQSVKTYQNTLKKAIIDAKNDVQALLGEFGINSFLDPNKGGGKGAAPKEGFAILEEQISKIKVALESAIISNSSPNVIDRLSISLTAAQLKLDTLKKTFDNSLLAGKGAPDLVGAKQLGVNGASSPLGLNTGTDSGTASSMQKAIDDITAYTGLLGKSRATQKEFNEETSKQAKIGREVANVFGNGLTNAFQSAFEGTQSFISAMGQFLGQLITRLLAAAAAAAVLAVILSAVGFGSGIGGAASAVGSFKNLFGSFSGVQLAEGGIVTSATPALIGEGREPEAVIPISKLDQFTSGNNGGGFRDGQIVGVLRGQNLLLQYQRASQSKGRTS